MLLESAGLGFASFNLDNEDIETTSLFDCWLVLLATFKILFIENLRSCLPSLLLISVTVWSIALYVKKLESRLDSLSSFALAYFKTFIGPFLGIINFYVWFNTDEVPELFPVLLDDSRTFKMFFFITGMPNDILFPPTKESAAEFYDPRREKLFLLLTTGAAATLTI